MKVYKLTLKGCGSFYTEDAVCVGNELESGEVGDSYTVEIVEMTREQLDALPEFGGF